MTSDADLLRKYSHEHSEAAFAELVRRHVDFVFAAACRQCGCPHRAEEVTQLVFTDLARKAARLRERDEIVGWLFVSTRYAAAKIARDEARRERREKDAAAVSVENNDGGISAEWDRLRPELDAALESLETADRTAVLLRVLKGLPYSQVGASLRTSEDAARKRVDRALEKLRQRLARRGIASTASALTLVISSQSAIAAPAGLAAKIASVAVTQAAALGTVGALAGVLEFMATTKVIVGVGFAAVALSVGSAVYEQHRKAEADAFCARAVAESGPKMAALSALKDQVEVAEREAAALEQKIREVSHQEDDSAGHARAAIQLKRSATSSVSAPAAQTKNTGELERGVAFLAAHPEAIELLQQIWRASSKPLLTELEKKLGGLTPDQRIVVEKYVMNHSAQGYTSNTEAIGLSLTDSGRPLTPEDEPEELAKLEASLGEKAKEFASAMVDARSAVAAGALVDRLASAVYETSTPLSPAQAEAMRGVLLKNNASYVPGQSTFSPASVEWSKVLSEAPKILSTAQVDALNAIMLQSSSIATLTRQRASLLQSKGGAR